MSNIGRILYGYCGGYFGDSYNNKRIESEGVDWVVAREIDSLDHNVVFADFPTEEDKKIFIVEYSLNPDDY